MTNTTMTNMPMIDANITKITSKDPEWDWLFAGIEVPHSGWHWELSSMYGGTYRTYKLYLVNDVVIEGFTTLVGYVFTSARDMVEKGAKDCIASWGHNRRVMMNQEAVYLELGF